MAATPLNPQIIQIAAIYVVTYQLALSISYICDCSTIPGHALILGSSTVHMTLVCPPTSIFVSKPKTSLSHDLNSWVLMET